MKKILLFLLTFFIFFFPTYAENSIIPDPTFSLLWYSNNDYIYTPEPQQLQDTLSYYCSAQWSTYISHQVSETTNWTRVYYDLSTNQPKTLDTQQTKYISSITCEVQSGVLNTTSPNSISKYDFKDITDTIYSEIAYQSNDWTYYINHKNLIDLIILITFTFFFIFTFVSLSIKFFKLWKK